jgi:alkaline phosphatase D
MLDRRAFLATAGAMFVLPRGVAGQRPRFTADPFALGVASGDPIADGIVLWTRLAPAPLDVGGGMPDAPVDVIWEVADDEAFRRIVRSGTVTARPDAAHSVTADVRGLRDDRVYWYRFRTYGTGGAVESPTGRTRTAPRPDAAVNEFRFAYASCQKYDDGLYTAHRHIADDDVRMVLFLGDYIYEGAGEPGAVRPHTLTEALTLDDYRRRYALYRSDPDLQLAHRAHPWMIVWDDHELFNDYSGHTVAAQAATRARQRGAYQAFAEHMPIRGLRTPGHDALQMHRRLSIGTLANLCLLDTRQYRSPAACGDGLQHDCVERRDATRTMLGSPQERWLFDTMQHSAARWQVVAQQIPFARVDREPGPGVSLHMDKWDGYPQARDRILEFLERRGTRDTVVLTGDNHNHWLMELRRDGAAESSEPITHELLGTSISSSGDGAEQHPNYAAVLSDNPHARYLNSRRGYTRCVVTPQEWRVDYRVVPYVSTPGASISTDASFVLTHGRARADKA